MTTQATFRGIWPIRDITIPWDHLVTEAAHELNDVAARAHVRITGQPRWSVAPASRVPGSGNTTDYVLLCDAPAEPRPPRPYTNRLLRTA